MNSKHKYPNPNHTEIRKTVHPIISKSEIKQLNIRLILLADEYYSKDRPSVTDAEYDGLYLEYQSAVKLTKFEPNGSILKHVGAPSNRMLHMAKLYQNPKSR